MIRSELCRSSGFEQFNELNIFHDQYLVQILDSRINPFAKELKDFESKSSRLEFLILRSVSVRVLVKCFLGPTNERAI